MNLEAIEALQREAQAELLRVKEKKELELFRSKYLSKKGPFQNLLKDLGTLPLEKRPEWGQIVHATRDAIETLFQKRSDSILEKDLQKALLLENIDVTLPGRRSREGGLHPISQAIEKAVEILKELGFSIHYGAHVDDNYHNFSSLNFPEDHPARDMQDTFYLSTGELLRTQTSNMQVRLMKRLPTPLRVVVPGKCFRKESVTARSHILFHQIEGLFIDRNVTLNDLLGTLEIFYEKFFDKKISLRLRPSYFPFVEPGIEVDLACLLCSGKGCGLCKQSGWLEVAGAGMVHPNVLQEGGLDPELFSGFAWGMGIERLVMISKGIQDIRWFTQNDLRFLEQF